ncbi:MAG: hypothetical protein AVDCRST_MAG12-694 [uncultured Rubrobacteraceae bacterium]|uniref:Uncharacterized protein n=1 Tax=uncultured Rubrobacteraceae bacterium TaxID=349277 RepID=A0A6J4RIP8_9ACTN|nr:MAG: hypothetical protein AVDCRST_MAG12-694 [uncultured Rubrobacteraceae bacterium]
MRRLSGSVLTCAVVVLGVGSILPRLVFAGEGVGAYSGEKRAFARFALVYDLVLREWPFPVDPTVARRVTEVSGTHNPQSPCTSEEGPKKGPYYTGYFAGDYRAEVVHYGPFFVPTGKNVFNCDGASTYSLFLPRDVDGVLFSVLGPAVFIGAFGLAVGTVLTAVYLTLGGGFLLARGSERGHRLVGLAAVLAGLLIAATTFFAISTTAI